MIARNPEGFEPRQILNLIHAYKLILKRKLKNYQLYFVRACIDTKHVSFRKNAKD